MAAKMLDSVGIHFVESVSGPVIKQLLDDLRKDKVLNTEEADTVTENNLVRADRARNLLNTVVRKGDAASMKMINRLQERDPELFVQLGLQAQLDALDQMDLC